MTSKPILTYLPANIAREPTIPFVGLAEGLVLAAIRRSGIPMQRVRPALDKLQQQMGVEHALASQKLYTDGVELLFDYAKQNQKSELKPSAKTLVVIRNGQRVFTEIIEQYLKCIHYGSDGYASTIRVPVYQHAQVVADPTRSFGSPIFEHGGSRVSDVLERFWAGESLNDLNKEFGVPHHQLEDVVRATSQRAA